MRRKPLEYAYRDELEAGTITRGQYASAQKTILKCGGGRFLDLFKNPTYVAAVVFVDIVMQITLYGALTWIPLYLSDSFGFRLQTMGWWSGLYFAAGAIGSFISSYTSDKVFKGNRMTLACFIGLAPFVVLLAATGESGAARGRALRHGLLHERLVFHRVLCRGGHRRGEFHPDDAPDANACDTLGDAFMTRKNIRSGFPERISNRSTDAGLR